MNKSQEMQPEYSTGEPPADPVGFVARSKIDGTIFRDFAKPGECHPINDQCEWMPVYARAPSPPGDSLLPKKHPMPRPDEYTLRINGRQAAQLVDFADDPDTSMVLRYYGEDRIEPGKHGEPMPAGLYAWYEDYPEEGQLQLLPTPTKSETVMSKVREHFDAQRDRDGYHSELERLEFAPPADPGPVQTFEPNGPERGFATMCANCGQTFGKHIAQDHHGNSSVCPAPETSNAL